MFLTGKQFFLILETYLFVSNLCGNKMKDCMFIFRWLAIVCLVVSDVMWMSVERKWYDADISALANIVARWVVAKTLKTGAICKIQTKIVYKHIYTHIYIHVPIQLVCIYKIICSSISKQANMNWREPMYWDWGGYKGLPRNWVHHAVLQIGCQIKLIFTNQWKYYKKRREPAAQE